MSEPVLQQLDQVELVTTRGVSYLSDRPGKKTDPHGTWSVVGFVEGDVLVARGSALVRVPLANVRKVSTYHPEAVLDIAKEINKYGKEDKAKD